MNEHDETCECSECIPHEDDCRCWDCEEQRLIALNRSYADAIWAQEQAAAQRANDLMGGGLSDDEE